MAKETGTGPVNTTQRLADLRAVMKQNNVHAYIVPSEDSHQSEYIAACDGRRGFISGFTGSAGLAVVTLESAALWTDGRYFLQASKQLDSNWTLQKAGLPETPSKEEWLNAVLPPRSRIGLDPSLITIADYRTLVKKLTVSPYDHQVVAISENLIDKVWSTRPARPNNALLVLETKYTGKSITEKFEQIRKELTKKKCYGFVVAGLDEVAWLFNLRGSDIPFNPVFFAYAFITLDSAALYVDDSKFQAPGGDAVRQYLVDAGVKIRPYSSIYGDLKVWSQQYQSQLASGHGPHKLWVDARTNTALVESLGGESQLVESRSPITVAKSIKTPAELEGFRQCHVRDAAALCEFFGWLENELVVKKNNTITEVSAADYLESLRAKQRDFMGLSFDTISSTGPNGAIIHYKPEVGSCAIIDPKAIYLCDSGGQYRDGTTDVTRTLHFGTPTAHEKKTYTMVLKGHISISRIVFPQGTTGYLLDVLARQHLWSIGLDYRHGTGHGVGSFLNVHEGPQGIGFRIGFNDTPMQPGMTITNEPGYYEDGAFGIRIENIHLVQEVDTEFLFNGPDKKFLGFENVTWVPLCQSLLDLELLDTKERAWINKYHATCLEKVAPLLEKESLAYKWLVKETKPLPL